MLAALWGAAAFGWQMGAGRHLFVTLVPHEKRTEYMAVFYAWVGLLGGAGPLLAGRALDHCGGISGRFLVFKIDEYTPLFAVACVLFLGGVLIMNWLRPRRGLGVKKFAAMFVRGNPVMAIESLVRYNLARDEGARVSMTERLGRARSPLNVDELIEALSDPSFNVRYEAVVTIARTRPDERLTDALLEILHADEPDLSIAAASALARIGDPRAIPALREALSSGYPLLEARSARALATLGDAEIIPALLERFRKEPAEGQRIAYASALGALRCTRAVPDLLACLRRLENQSSRMEVALALARTVGHEQYFMRLARDMRSEPGTPAARALSALRKKMARLGIHVSETRRLAGECEEALARGNMDGAAELLVKTIRAFPAADPDAALAAILDECADRLAQSGAERIEHVPLALHTLNAALDRMRDAPPPR